MPAAVDNLDREAIELTIASRGWYLIEERFRRMLAQKTAELRKELPVDKTHYLRGYLDGVERCLEIPQMVIEEMEREHAS